MIFPAPALRLYAHHSIWYAVNLLWRRGCRPLAESDAPRHCRLSLEWTAYCDDDSRCGFAPCRPALRRAAADVAAAVRFVLGGIVAPLLWTGLLHSTLAMINPAFNAAHRLDVVRRVADRLRYRRGNRGGKHGTHPHASVGSVHAAHGH